jgi:hypothetical protein
MLGTLKVGEDRREIVEKIGWINLGQSSARLRVSVMDRRGEPAEGIKIVVLGPRGNLGEGVTDSDGAFLWDVVPDIQEVVLVASLPEGEVRQRVFLSPLGMTTASFRSIKRIDGYLVTPVEGVASIAGVGLIVTGALLGRVFGDIIMGIGGSITAAAVYSAVSRHV